MFHGIPSKKALQHAFWVGITSWKIIAFLMEAIVKVKQEILLLVLILAYSIIPKLSFIFHREFYAKYFGSIFLVKLSFIFYRKFYAKYFGSKSFVNLIFKLFFL